jgi:hypothetical protein
MRELKKLEPISFPVGTTLALAEKLLILRTLEATRDDQQYAPRSWGSASEHYSASSRASLMTPQSRRLSELPLRGCWRVFLGSVFFAQESSRPAFCSRHHASHGIKHGMTPHPQMGSVN